jgi:serine/threonine protein kinase
MGISMKPDDLYVIPEALQLFPTEHLPAAVRRQVTDPRISYAATIVGSRRHTKVMDAATGELLEQFGEPSSMIDAVLRISAAGELNPQAVLESAYPVLLFFVREGLIIPVESREEQAASWRFGPGDVIGSFRVLRQVHLLEDSGVYQAESAGGEKVALKVAFPATAAQVKSSFSREAGVLRRLQGPEFPRLLAAELDGTPPFLALEWIEAPWCTVAADKARRPWSQAGAETMLRSAVAVAKAYAALHAQGVVHGDVHPKNVLLSPPDSARLVDFGHSLIEADDNAAAVPRAAVLTFFAPEWASAVLGKRRQPPASQLSDQYGLAALLYMMFTGRQCIVAGQETTETLRQIAQVPPLPFDVHGVRPWPAVEEVLARAMAKDPDDRFPAVSDMVAALEAIAKPPPRPRAGTGRPADAAMAELLDCTVSRLSRPGGLIDRGLPTSPLVSVNYGAAGIAYLFYRLACLRGRAEDLATAIRWLDAADRDRGSKAAYHNRDIGIVGDRVGEVSPYHSVTGVHCVKALVANAMGDLQGAEKATAAFTAASRRRCENLDLTTGRAGSLIAGALLAEALQDTSIPRRCGLLDLGTEIMGGIWHRLAGQDCLNSDIGYLGIAHGWAGLMFASLRWCQATGDPLPDDMRDRLDELAALAIRDGRGVRWRGPRDPSLPVSWCHGSTGYVHLWLESASLLEDERLAQHGLDAAEYSWAHPSGNSTLCCGSAGQAYAMLRAYQHTKDAIWLTRARRLAHNAREAVGSTWCQPNSLYKGDAGIALLAADLVTPERSCMPLFASERWAQQHSGARLRHGIITETFGMTKDPRSRDCRRPRAAP